MASSNDASQPTQDEARADFRDGWSCPKHPDVLLQVKKKGDWKIVKESCRKCDVLFDLEGEARRRDLGLAPAGPNLVPPPNPAAAPEVPPPAVAVAAMPDRPEEVPVAVAVPAVPAVPHQPSVEQVTAKSLTDARGNNGTYTGSILRDTDKPHGYGKMEYDNGDVYEGGWKDGWHDGVYTWGPGLYQGAKYEGGWKGHKHYGRGV